MESAISLHFPMVSEARADVRTRLGLGLKGRERTSGADSGMSGANVTDLLEKNFPKSPDQPDNSCSWSNHWYLLGLSKDRIVARLTGPPGRNT